MDSIVLSYAHERAYAKVTELKSRQKAKEAKQNQGGKRAAADGSA